LQPIERFGFDGAILFADILLIAQALGARLWFETGVGPRLSTLRSRDDVAKLKAHDAIHETLSPIYQTLRNLSGALPDHVTLIGFAGSPWTVASYMIAGRSNPQQTIAHQFKAEARGAFDALIERLTQATIAYLREQIKAGADVVKLFDSWAGSLQGQDFHDYCLKPNQRIIQALRAEFPKTPIIAFPRGVGHENYLQFTKAIKPDVIAIDQFVDVEWAANHLQPLACVQGNLDPSYLLAANAKGLVPEVKRIVRALANGAHIFNLGHGITPDANIAQVEEMIQAVRG